MDRNDDLPVLCFDWSDLRIQKVAENIYHALCAGWPDVLTYDLENDTTDKRRRAMRGELIDPKSLDPFKFKVPTIRSDDPELNLPSRDEYPFACTKEHVGSVWIGHVPPEQNSLQGWMIRDFLLKQNATDGFRFRVRVCNRPS